ncbi:hypothetical protein LTR41_011229 [Exophiala xenobiotica]|nr:hypothetical protein LTR41_011229 [Exophiala xenobiotica]
MSETWGFVGLGNIGYPMAMNLREKMPASHTLVIRDTNVDAMKRFVEEVREMTKSKGAASNSMKLEVANNAGEVAEKSTVLITCLPSPQIVKVLFQGILKDGQLPPLELERLFIDCSTIDPPSSKEVAESVHTSHSGSFVDAPVSGGTVGARAGTLSFMFGAPKSSQLLGRVKAPGIWGEQGAGVSSKLVNNYILSITNIATAEGLNMGRQLGLDLKTLTELIKSSTGRCWPLEANNPVPGVDENAPASHGYKPGGTVNIVKKDLGLAMVGAEASGTSLPLASAAYKVYQDVGESDGGKDF